jgi:hypothetical protein
VYGAGTENRLTTLLFRVTVVEVPLAAVPCHRHIIFISRLFVQIAFLRLFAVQDWELCVTKYIFNLNMNGETSDHCILIYVQQDARLRSLFYLETALHVSGGTITHHQERKQLHLQHLVFVIPLLVPAAMAAGTSNGITNTRCGRYSCLRS